MGWGSLPLKHFAFKVATRLGNARGEVQCRKIRVAGYYWLEHSFVECTSEMKEGLGRSFMGRSPQGARDYPVLRPHGMPCKASVSRHLLTDDLDTRHDPKQKRLAVSFADSSLPWDDDRVLVPVGAVFSPSSGQIVRNELFREGQIVRQEPEYTAEPESQSLSQRADYGDTGQASKSVC